MQKFRKLFGKRTFMHKFLAAMLVLSMALPSFSASATDAGDPSFDNGYSTSDEDIKDESADGEVTQATQQNNQSANGEQDKQTTDDELIIVKKPVMAPGSNINYDLKNFIKRATLAGENITIDGDNWKVINSGINYNMSLGFDESDSYQFSENDTVMNYTLPDGVKALGGGTIPISVKANGKTYVVEDNKFTISNDGKIISLKLNTNDPDLAELNKASNATFTLNFEAVFDLEDGKKDMDFGNKVVKHLEVKNSHNAGVTKTYEYDSTTGELVYTINVKATGKCENITVTDTMDGTAYAVKQDSITCTPNNVGFNISAKSDTGFTATIGSLSNQTAKITYRAYLKNSSMVGADGTVTAGKNTVKVDTAEDSNKDDNKATTPNKTFPVTSVLEKTGSVVEEDGKPKVDSDGNVTINWLIKVNNEKIIPLNGVPIKDTISENQFYSGTGITVKKTGKNGAETTSKISWSDLSKTDTSFTFTPNDSTPYLYEISYATKTKASEQYTDYKVSNTVNFKGKDTQDDVGIGVPEGGKFKIQKDLVNVDKEKKEISWVITMTIPPGGLPHLVLRDAYPHCKDPNNDKITLYYDSLVAGSLNISGLEPGESYKIYNDEDAYKRLKVQFYQDEAQKITGLKGTGKSRNITVNLTTKLNEEWLEYAKNNMTTGKQEQRHSNYAEAQINKTYTSDYARVYLSDPVFKKSLIGGLKWANASDGSTLPYLDYSLLFTNVTEDEFTINETLPEGFTFYKEAINNESADIYKSEVIGGDSPNAMHHQSNGSVTFEGDNKIKVKVPKRSDGDFYTYYEIKYHIIAKNSAAAKALNQRAVDNNGTIELTNTAEYNGITDSASIDYTPDIGYYLWKSLTNESELSDYQNEAKYSININHLGLKLNNGNNVTLTDKFENLDIDYSSITFNPASACVSYDVKGSTLTAVIKDETPVILTYNAKVNGSGKVTFNNTAEIAGHSQKIENTKNFKVYDAGSGSASILNIRIMKYEAGNMNNKLANVSFKLYKATTIDPTTKTATAGEPVTDKTGKQVTVTTDANGYALITGNISDNGWELKADQAYYVEEVAPLNGYEEDHTKYTFTISSDGSTDYTNYKYRDNDILKITNKKKVNYPLTITKTMTGDIPKDIDLYDIVIRVTDSDGKAIEGLSTTLGEIADNAKVGKSGFEYDKTTNKYKWTVSGLTKEQDVYIIETVKKTKDGYALSKKYNIDNGETKAYPDTYGISATAGQTVNLINEYTSSVGSLKVTKTSTGAPASEADKKYSFTVTKDGKWYNKNGTASTTEVKHNIKAGETITFDGLTPGVYKVEEVAASAVITGYTLDTESVTSQNIEINAAATKNVTLKNTYTQDKGKLSIKKTVSTVNTAGTVDKTKLPTVYRFAVKNADGNYIKDTNGTVGDKTAFYFSGIAENATLTINNLPVGKYIIEEQDARVDGLTLTTTGLGEVTVTKDNTTSKTVNNEYETPKKPVGELHIKKKMDDNSDEISAGKTFPISIAFDKAGSYAVNVDGSGSKMIAFKAGAAQTFDIKSNGTIDVVDIPLDTTYTVSENLSEEDKNNGYSTVSISNGTKKISTDGQNEEVTVTNNYTAKKFGALIIEKTVTGDKNFAEVRSKLEFTVEKNSDASFEKKTISGSDTKWTETPVGSDKWQYSLDNLPVGTYTVTETKADVEGMERTTTVTSGGTTSTKNSAAININDGSNVAVTFKNNYTKEPEDTGSLTIKKTVSTVNTNGTVDKTTLPVTYQFAVKNADGNYIMDLKGTVGDNTIFYLPGIKENETLTINNLVVGNYTIEEKDARVDGLTLTTTELGEVTITKDANTSKTVNNEYETPKKPAGELHITKKIADGSDEVPEGKAFPITLAFDKDGSYAVNVNGTGSNMVAFKAGVAQTFNIKSNGTIDVFDIPLNTAYTVSETLSNEDTTAGYSMVSISSDGKGTIATDGQTDNVTITNKFTKPVAKGSLKITKTFEGDKPAADKMGNVTFTITKEGMTPKTVYYKDADASGSITINDLEPGTYTVTESQYKEEGKTVTIKTTVSVPEAPAANGTADNVTVEVKADTVSEAAFTNTYTKDESASEQTSSEQTSSEQITSEQTTSEQTTSEQTTSEQTTSEQATTVTPTTAQQTTSPEITTERKNVNTKKKKTDDDNDDDDDDESGKGKLIITIHDEKTGKVVPGAKVTITTASGKTRKYTADSNGQVSIKNAEAGDYTVKVTEVPDGYTVTKNKEFEVEVKKNKTTTALVKINKEGEVSVTTKTVKTTAKTGDEVPVKPIAVAFTLAVLGLIILMFKKRQDI